MSEGPAKQQGRGIGGIAHFFLSRHPANGGRQPVRRGPGEEQPTASRESTPVSGEGGKEAVPQRESLAAGRQAHNAGEAFGDETWSSKRPRGSRAPAGIAVLAGHLPEGRKWAEQLARQWAAANERVGLLHLEAEGATLREYVAAGEAPAGQWGEAAEITEALAELGGRCETLLVAVGAELQDEVQGLIERCRHVVVCTTTAPDDVVAAYKLLKWLGPAAWQDKDVALLVCGAADESAARQVHEKLAETAWEFLSIDVGWAGWVRPARGGEGAAGRTLSSSEDAEEALAAVLDLLAGRTIETTKKTKGMKEESGLRGPGSRWRQEKEPSAGEAWAAPAGGVDTATTGAGCEYVTSEVGGQWGGPAQVSTVECGPVGEQAGTVAAGPAGQEGRRVTEAMARAESERTTPQPAQFASEHTRNGFMADEGPSGTPPERGSPAERTAGRRPQALELLSVRRLPEDDAELAEALEHRLPVWQPGALPLPVRVAESLRPGVRVMVDGAGRLWALAAGLAGGTELLARGLAGRKWLGENAAAVAAGWGQVRVDRSLSVGLLLAAGAGAEELRAACGQISEFPCTVRQVHSVYGEMGAGLLVI